LLQNLGSQPENDVYIISGRNSEWLETFFGNLPVNLIAEHGAKMKRKNGRWISDLPGEDEWKEDILKIMENYTRRCAHTFVEVKDFSIVWHYRNAIPEQAKLRSLELLTELNEFTHHRDLQVLMGNKIVEVRKYGIDKGTTVKKFALKEQHNFVLAIGDDNTDEDMFKVLMKRQDAYTIKVGPDASFAKYNLSTPQMVLSLLDAMAYIRKLAAA
jgi:trehalose 6-phosphate synthase/phosphatase